MRNLKLEEIVKEATRFVSQSGMSFDAFNPTEYGIGEIYNVLEVTSLLPQCSIKPTKSDVSSERFRTRGNQAFVSSKNDMAALCLYTKAVSSASPDGPQISLAYANRSAVTFALKEYTDSIKDIDRALGGSYPDHLRYKLIERRGKCYLSLSQTQKALDDFKEVKNFVPQSNLSEEKMNSFYAQIERLIKETAVKNDDCFQSPSELPKLTHDPSPYIQCASSAVDIAFSPQMGRHIVASTDIFPGDILAIEKPYASVLLPPSYTLFCDFCKKRCHSPVPCLYCCDVLFCDASCRENSWSSHHSIECDLLPSLTAIGCDKMEFLAVRVLLTATRCGEIFPSFIESYFNESLTQREVSKLKGSVNNFYLSDDYNSTHHLETNREFRSDEDMFRRGAVAACIIHVMKEATGFFQFYDLANCAYDETYLNKFNRVSDLCSSHLAAGDMILRYLMSAPCNAHEIAEMRVWPLGDDFKTESTEIGGAIYPFHSLINHSCDPNVVRHAFNGDTVVLSSIQFIKKGAQIFDNYGYHHAIHDIATRREHLNSQYYFTCDCVACLKNWPLYQDLPEGSPTYKIAGSKNVVQKSSDQFAKILLEIKRGNTTDDNFHFLIQHLTVLHQNIERPWREYNQCQEAIKQCLSLKANHYIHKNH